MTTLNEEAALSEADEIEALLPWYVTGKLDAADKSRVERYIERHPDVAGHLVLARDEAHAVIIGNEAIRAPGRDALPRLRAAIAANPRPSQLTHAAKGWLDRIGEWLASLSEPRLGFAAAAAALVIAVQAATIGGLVVAPPESRFGTASAPGDATAGTFALVSFKPDAPAGALAQFLADNGYSVVEGPKPGGVWRVRLAADKLTPGDAAAVIAKLKARQDLVGFASPAP